MSVFRPQCLSCKEQLRELTCLGSNAFVLAVGVGGTHFELKKTVLSKELVFPVVLGNAKLLNQLGGVTVSPQTFVISKEGVIINHWVGVKKCSDVRELIRSFYR